MRILCTHPGKFGDLLWALPTCRALSETYQTPVDLVVAKGFGSLTTLLQRQPYVGVIMEDLLWETQDTAPRTPRTPPTLPGDSDQVFHLGYDGWPAQRLAEQIWAQAQRQLPSLAPLALDRPWIQVPDEDIAAVRDQRRHLVVGFTAEWIELKVGVCFALKRALKRAFAEDAVVDIIKPPGNSRWDEWSFRDGLYATSQDWPDTAALIAGADVFLGDLSAQWVLANALGVRTIVCEPSKMRWDSPGGWHESIFWRPSPLNTMVLGTDGLPTFDARAVCATVIEALRQARTEDADEEVSLWP